MVNLNLDGLYIYTDISNNTPASFPINNKSVSVPYTGTPINYYLKITESGANDWIISCNNIPSGNGIDINGPYVVSNDNATGPYISTLNLNGPTQTIDVTTPPDNGKYYQLEMTGGNTPTGDVYNITFSSSYGATFSCFLPTTRILMADNTYKQISKIKAGESIRGLSGISRRVLHAGYLNFRPENTHPESLPRCIPMNFFGKNLPRENLYLSGGHSIILLESTQKYKQEIEETERETSRTVNMSGYRKLMSKKLSNLKVLKTTEEIKQITGTDPRYYHLVIDDLSDGMIADGLPVEATSEADFISQGFISN